MKKRKRRNIKINAALLCIVLIIMGYFITSIITYATTETLPIVCTDANLYNKLSFKKGELYEERFYVN